MKKSGFKMKGPSIVKGTQAHRDALNLNRQGYENLPDGREKSSAFQQNADVDATGDSPLKQGVIGAYRAWRTARNLKKSKKAIATAKEIYKKSKKVKAKKVKLTNEEIALKNVQKKVKELEAKTKKVDKIKVDKVKVDKTKKKVKVDKVKVDKTKKKVKVDKTKKKVKVDKIKKKVKVKVDKIKVKAKSKVVKTKVKAKSKVVKTKVKAKTPKAIKVSTGTKVAKIIKTGVKKGVGAAWWLTKNIGVPGAIGYGGYKYGQASQAGKNIETSTVKEPVKETLTRARDKYAGKKLKSYAETWKGMSPDKQKAFGDYKSYVKKAEDWWKTKGL